MAKRIYLRAVMALVLTAGVATRAAAQNPFIIDGVVPANGSPSGPAQTTDPFGNTKELGPVNGNATKVGVIHSAVPPMLSFTNPNGQVDLRNIWTQTSKTLNGDIWFYFAWERDANTGSGFIAYEFQQSALSPSCAYTAAGVDMLEPQSPAETALINSCNPWQNRQPGDFLILWDQSGSALTITKRVFSLSGGQLVLGPVQALGSAVAAISADGFRGEAAINLTTDVFPPDGSCVSFANIIPGTVTGNSDSADYKDTVLAPFAPISSCGIVTVTKVTNPGGLTGTFPYTLRRADGSAIRFDGTLAINQTLTFDGDSTGSPIPNLVAGTNYTLTEAPQTSPWQLQSISCTTHGLPAVDLTSGGTFVVEANTTTACTITNRRLRGSIRVIKRVLNDNGGTAQASAFTISLGDSANTTFGGVENPGIQYTFDHGYAFNVTEIALPTGYAMTGMTGECSGAIVAEVTKVCTITNDDVAPRLTVIKHVVNDNGGTATANQWTMNVAATSPSAASFPGVEAPGTTITLNAGSFNVTETGGPSVGYSQTSAVGCSGTIAVGESKTCTITNDDQPARLTVIKHVVNDNGGTATANQWTMNVAATNPSTASFPGAEAPGTTITVNVGSFNVTESGGPAGYTQTGAVGCSGTIAVGESKTCTITNDDVPPQLIVIKRVINDNGGTATANQWTMNVAATSPSAASFPGAEAPGTTITLNVGSFNVTETGGPAGYTQTSAVGCSGTIAIGETKTCTLTNDDIPPQLTVIKRVINDNGGTATANQWTMNVAATNPSAASFPGAEAPGTTITLNAGSFSVAESGGPDGYVQTSAVGCSGTIAVGESKTCTITNDDVKANPTASTFMGWVLHDSATVAGIRLGAPDASSATVTFRLYGPGDSSCSTPINGAGEVRPLAGGTASTVAGFTITQAQAGQYRWIAVYSGDQFNSPTATACGAETHTITVQSPQ